MVNDSILFEYLPNKILPFHGFFLDARSVCVALIYIGLDSNSAFYCRPNWNFIEKVSPLNIKEVTATVYTHNAKMNRNCTNRCLLCKRMFGFIYLANYGQLFTHGKWFWCNNVFILIFEYLSF